MSSLSAQDEELLAYLLEEEGIDVCQSIPRRRNNNGSPLSFSQQRLWFLQELEPTSAAYNLPRALHLRGALHVGALERSFNEIVRRHEVLRTSFTNVNGEAVQIVNPAHSIPLTLEDLSALAVTERETCVRQLVLEESRVPFDLSKAPLIRLKLLRLAEDEHVLLLTMHHIVSDEWSTGIFINEIGSLYQAFVRGAPSPLPDLPIQYADYAEWQTGWLKSEQAGEQFAYWKKQLAGELPSLELPLDHQRPPVQTFNGASRSLPLGATLYEAVKQLSREENATLFMTLFAAFAALLHRYSGQEDILVGSPIAGRERHEVEGLIGFFVNTLVLRVDFSGDLSFRSLLGQVREVALGAYANQSLPFEFLVRELQPERSSSHTPLFQITFATRTAPGEAPPISDLDLEVSSLHYGVESAKFDIFLSVDDTGLELNANVIYNADLFDGVTIERMLRHYQTLLESAVVHPDRAVSSLSMLAADEVRQLLVEWNDTARAYPRESSIQAEFEAQAERRPSAVAVSYHERQLSYGELNERANQVAHWLRQEGVRAEGRVGLCVTRSELMVIGVLGILKAGGAYVPLDAQYPASRLEFMLADAEVTVVLTEASLADVLAPLAAGVALLRLDEDRELLAAQEVTNPVSAAGAENLAYLIYTSGSSGAPKAVAVTHRAVLRLVLNTNYAQFDEERVVLLGAPLAFDASTFELWGALLHGGRLVLLPEAVPTARQLRELIASSGLTTMWLTASLFNYLVDEEAEALGGVKQLLVGGEALSAKHIEQALASLSGTELINGYGPTEATTFSCTYKIESVGEGGSIPIGQPVANTRVYVLDSIGGLVPVGVAGELYIGGEGLARGYWRRAELTAERFVPDGVSGRLGERLYRTGDRVRYLADGNLEFLGRIDEQVKLRGFRIELGEIETALTEHDSVAEAVVLAHDFKGTEKRLVAYVVCERERYQPSITELSLHLRERLPEYMIPSYLVILDALPLTPNGKVDRRALPAPEPARPELDGTYVAPRSLVEEIVAQIWSDALAIDQVGVHDNFFALGGHSLLATTIVTRLRQVFNIDLPLRPIFEGPTVAQLSEFIQAAQRAGKDLSQPPLVRVSREQPLPLSFAQERLWFNDQLMPGGNFAYNVQLAVRLQGRLDVAALEQALNKLEQRHESLRTNFKTVEGRPVQVIRPESSILLTFQDLSGAPEDHREAEASRLATAATQQTFDLSTDALLRALLFRLDDNSHVLMLIIHHIVCDAWSMGVLIHELAALYETCRQGREPALAELPIQYADYARWQRDWLQGDQLEKQLAYWRRTLTNVPELQLRISRPRPAIQSFRGAHLAFTLPADLSASLRELSRREDVTLYIVMLGAFKALLHYYSQSEEIVVGTDVANRSRVETEGLIGFLANQLVLRTSLADDPAFTEILSRLREVSLEAFVHQDAPFEEVVKALDPERNLDRNPLFQIMFGFSNTPPPVVTLPELRVSGLEIEKGTAVFDLSLYLTETAQGLNGMLRYRTDLFESNAIERLREHYEMLLAHVVLKPEARLSELCGLLAAADREHQQQTAAELKKNTRQLFQNVRRRAAL